MTKIYNIVCTLIVVIGIASMEKIFEALDAEYELVSDLTDIEGCNGRRRRIGEDMGKNDPDTKLQMCANKVRDDSRCGPSFFFRKNKGRCFCEEEGAPCLRKYSDNRNEYVLKNVFWKKEGQFCPFCNGTYRTLEEAVISCTPNPECNLIYDLFCDGAGYFCSCPISSVKNQTHPLGIDCIYKRI